MEQFLIEKDNEKDIEFTGELIACVASSPDQAIGSNYSGSTGRWQELNLYRSEGGKFVCERINFTKWQGERTQFDAAVYIEDYMVTDFFGSGWLAKDLYKEAGIDYKIVID